MKTILILLTLATAQAFSSSTICANEVDNIQSNGLIMERETRENREVTSVTRKSRSSREVRKSRNVRSERLLRAFREVHTLPIARDTRSLRMVRLARATRPDRKIYFVIPDKECPQKLVLSFYIK